MEGRQPDGPRSSRSPADGSAERFAGLPAKPEAGSWREQARRAPALLPGAALLTGAGLGLARPATPIGAVIAVGLLGLSLGTGGGGSGWARRSGRLLVALVVGFVAGALAGREPVAPDPGRPVAAVACVTGHWRHDEGSWSAPVRIVRLRQGTAIEALPRDAILRLPGDEPPPPLGTRLRVKGALRRAPGLGNLPPLRPGPWRLSTKSRRLVTVEREAGPLGIAATKLRRRVERAIDRATATESNGLGRAATPGGALAPALVRALVLGDASRVPLRVRQGLRRLGLAHVLAVSGLHVGLVAGILLVLASGWPRVARLAVALAGVTLYLLLVGPRPSLLRASVMAGLAAAALLAQRPPQVTNALAVAAAGLCLADPRILLDAGFRLTVAATAGIVLVGPRLASAWATAGDGIGLPKPTSGGGLGSIRDRLSRRVAGRRSRRALAGSRRALAASVGAQIGVLPWALPLFYLVTPWAPLANLAAVPWTGLALTVCLAWTAAACLVPGAAHAVGGLLALVAAPFAWPALVPPRPWIDLAVSVGAPAATALAIGLLLLLGGAVPWWRRLRARQGGVGLAVLVLVAVGFGVSCPGGNDGDGRGPSGVSVVMIDVGQGDAILLRDGSRAALVDGGGWRYGDLGGRVLLPVLARLGVRRLDAVIVSHPDRDHCGGLVDIAGYLAVGEAISGPGIGASRCGRGLADLPGFGRPVPRREVARAAVLRVGRWRLRVLHPAPASARAGLGRSDNDDSLVLLAEAFGRRLLLTGDIESRTERALVRSVPGALRCDLLKVAHHGSKTSTGGAFLAAASPRVALISAGAHNPYGHPAEQVLARLASRRIRVVRTDRDGMIVVTVRPTGRILLSLPGAPKA